MEKLLLRNLSLSDYMFYHPICNTVKRTPYHATVPQSGFAPKVTLESDFKVKNLTLGSKQSLGAKPRKAPYRTKKIPLLSLKKHKNLQNLYI